MPISVVCQCGAKLNVKDELAGRAVKCPKCSQTIKVPGAAAQPAKPNTAASEKKPAKPQSPAPATADSLGGLLDEVGVAGPPVKHDIACPKCGAGMAEGAVLCIACGYNTKTGKQTASISDGAALAKREAYFELQAAKANAQQAKILGSGSVTSSGTKVKESNPAAELSTLDYVFCILCGWIATIVCIIYLVTGNPRGLPMLKVNLIAQAVMFVLGIVLGAVMGTMSAQ